MEIVNSLSILRAIISSLLLSVILAGCQNMKIKSRQEAPSPVITYGEAQSQNTSAEETVLVDTPSIEESTIPKFGIILGSGGARTFLYSGFLKELANRKASVHAISGVEWGALVAGLFAVNQSANDVEWQLSKIKEEMVFKKSLIPGRSEPGRVDQISGFLNDFFKRKDLKDFSVSFSCPAIRYKTEQSFMMARGHAVQAISYCLPSVGILNPHQGYGSSQFDYAKVAEFLKSQGATYIVLVTVISDRTQKIENNSESLENLYWHQVAHAQASSHLGIDAVVQISAQGFSVLDFKKSREIIRESHDVGAAAARKFLQKWKL